MQSRYELSLQRKRVVDLKFKQHAYNGDAIRHGLIRIQYSHICSYDPYFYCRAPKLYGSHVWKNATLTGQRASAC